MDKASLLAGVIKHLKELKRKAAEASEDSVIPNDTDEVKVEQDEELEGKPYSIKVSLSCNYRPGLLSDLRQALDDLHLIIMKAETATLGGRMKNVFVMTSCKDENTVDGELCKVHASTIGQTLRSVLNRFSDSEEFLGTTVSNKRRRASIFSS